VIEDLNPYPDYKDSGLAWLGEVPVHWGIARGRQLFEVRKRIAGTLGYPVLSITQQGLRVKDVSRGEGQLSQDYSKYQLVNAGEFAMNAMDLITGGVGIAAHEGVTSPDYRVFAIRNEKQHNSRFYLLLLRMLYANLAFYSCGQGSAQLGRWRLPRKRFNDFFFPTPPASEQAAIARFLAWVTNRLDRAIGAKRRIIALLQEQKQAIIHRAVTRGLDPTVPLKDSGILWLGEIPEHWEVITIGAIAELLQTGPFGSQLHQRDYVFGGIPVINPSHLSGGEIRPSSGVTITIEKAVALSRHRLRANDILIARRGDLGRCAAVSALEEGWICGTGSLLLRCKSSVIQPDFLQIVFSSRGMCQMLELSSIGATMANLNEGSVARQRIPLPPLAEQEEIVASARISSEIVNTAIIRLESEIALLREYRTRLIADVVTGKLDVQEVAAGLPEEIESDDAQDATEEDLDLDAEDEAPENIA
jgi:type I restriction enzyme S subunit